MKKELAYEEALEIAVSRSWVLEVNTRIHWKVTGFKTDKDNTVLYFGEDREMYFNHPYAILFRLDFAKALWGIKVVETDFGGETVSCLLWEYHLMNMAISEDKYKYLAENLPSE